MAHGLQPAHVAMSRDIARRDSYCAVCMYEWVKKCTSIVVINAINWSLTSLSSQHYWNALARVHPTLCVCSSEKKKRTQVMIFQTHSNESEILTSLSSSLLSSSRGPKGNCSYLFTLETVKERHVGQNTYTIVHVTQWVYVDSATQNTTIRARKILSI